MSDNEGSQRLLTPGEIALAKSIFGNSIVYPRVWIHHASYFPFKLQGRNTAMSPNGELYFRTGIARIFQFNLFSFNIFSSMKCRMSGSIKGAYGYV